MYRLGTLQDGEWAPHRHPPTYAIAHSSDGTRRIASGNPGSNAELFSALLRDLGDAVALLYVLHTPRGEGARGRYQSPWIARDEALAFVDRYSDFFSADGRFDLWAYSTEPRATLVWDRHDMLFGYGPIERFEATLRAKGFEPGDVGLRLPHEHHYRPQCDDDAAAVLSAFEWHRTDLAPSDEQ